MNALSAGFVAAVVLQAALRLWLATRQIGAVTAHRDRVPPPFDGRIALAEQQRAADYTVARTRIGRWTALTDALLVLLLTVGGGLARAGAAFQKLAWPEPWRGTAFVLGALLALQLAGLPFAIWRTFAVEARFGFNRTTPGLFAADFGKQLLLAFTLGAPLVVSTLALIQYAGRWWWLWAWGVLAGAMFALTWAGPRYIAPWFNRFSALDDEPLRKRVTALAQRCGFSAGGGVFVMDGSRRSAHGNAYFTGIGRNKRIVLFDTLLARLDHAQIEAVLAHELGHFKLRHVRRRLIVAAALGLGALALLAWLARQPPFYTALGVAAPSPAMAVLLFIVAAPVFTYFTTPLLAAWSRRHEREADGFAAEHADAGALADALVRLYRDNASTLTPDRLHSAFYDSHPPALERIARLKALAAAP